MLREIWAHIPNHSFYMVSNLGRIKRVCLRRKGSEYFLTERIKRLYQSTGGYLMVQLKDDNKRRKIWMVHRVVALAFIGYPPKERYEINHIDGKRKNNSPGNLEYVNRGENIRHAQLLGHISFKKPKRLLSTKERTLRSPSRRPILQFSKDGRLLKEYPSIRMAARENGLHSPGISFALRGYRNCKQSGGYIWKYKNQ